MKSALVNTLLFTTMLISSCNQIKEDSCYDMGHLWDPASRICSDDCVRSGGVFEVADKQCVLSSASEITDLSLLNLVQGACSEVQETLEDEFGLTGTTELKHLSSLKHDFPEKAPITYTSKYGFGQDGVCNFAQLNGSKIKVFIRKNSNTPSRYSVNEFAILKIEQRQADRENPTIIFD